MRDLSFVQDSGKTYDNGKSCYPTLLRLNLKRDQAIELAQLILTKFKTATSKNEEYLYEIPLFGDIKDITE